MKGHLLVEYFAPSLALVLRVQSRYLSRLNLPLLDSLVAADFVPSYGLLRRELLDEDQADRLSVPVLTPVRARSGLLAGCWEVCTGGYHFVVYKCQLGQCVCY